MNRFLREELSTVCIDFTAKDKKDNFVFLSNKDIVRNFQQQKIQLILVPNITK